MRDPQRSRGDVRGVVQQVRDHAVPLARVCHMAELLVAGPREIVVEAGDPAHRFQQIDAVAVEAIAAVVVHDERRGNSRYYAIPRSRGGNIHLAGLRAVNCEEARREVDFEKEPPGLPASRLIPARGDGGARSGP